jgi:hypothetical protein
MGKEGRKRIGEANRKRTHKLFDQTKIRATRGLINRIGKLALQAFPFTGEGHLWDYDISLGVVEDRDGKPIVAEFGMTVIVDGPQKGKRPIRYFVPPLPK